MMTKRLYILIVGLAMNVVAFAQSSLLPYKNPVLSVDERVKDLLSRMTLEEKVGQLLCPLGWEMYEIKDDEVHPSEKFKRLMKEKNAGMLWATYRADPWTKKTLENGLNPELAAKAGNALQKYVIENTRLGIPLFLAEEAPHGHMAIGTTVFPTGIGMAATWSPVLIEEVGNVIAKEIRSQGAHISYGPVLDLSRDPRWSRVEETFGEDPVLSGRLGAAMVIGLGSGDLSREYATIATLKHFLAYAVPEGGQNGNYASVGTRDLHENFLPPFQEAIDAGALSVMTSYNSIDGIPCTANYYLLTQLLRNEWRFRGFVVSDLYSIEGVHESHFVAPTIEEAASRSEVIIAVVGGSSARDFKTSYQETGAAIADEKSISDMECGEGFDRATLTLLGKQQDLLNALKATGKPLIVVYIEGRPLDKVWASEYADALLTASYPGQEGGYAIADVLFGDYNPAGRLPVSVPRSVGQIPVYYNKKAPCNHDYVEQAASPLYTFGYGLSYTTFEYSDLQVMRKSPCYFEVSFKVKNTGSYDGEEVAQLYLRDEYASVVQPLRQLKCFERFFLKRGEEKEIFFTLTEKDLSIIDRNMKRVVETGDFRLMIGASSDDIRLTKDISVESL